MEVASPTAPRPGRTQVDGVWWIRLLIETNNYSRSCAKKLGGGWERDKAQRAAKRYDDDRHSKYMSLRLLLLYAVVVEAKALPLQTNLRYMTKSQVSCRYGANVLAALSRVEPDEHGPPWCFQHIEINTQGVGV